MGQPDVPGVHDVRNRGLAMEEWRDIAGYDGKYKISNYGNVLNTDFFKKGITVPITPYACNDSFLYVGIDRQPKAVHRLVAQAFIPNPDKLSDVRHKDGDKTNNHTDNLEWCSRQSRFALGKAWEKRRKPIKAITADGEEELYDSIATASKVLGVSKQAVQQALRGISKTCCGRTWHYR